MASPLATMVITGDSHGKAVYEKLSSPRHLLSTNAPFIIDFDISPSTTYSFTLTQDDEYIDISTINTIYCKRIAFARKHRTGQAAYISDFINSETQETISAILGTCQYMSGGTIYNHGKQFNLQRNKITQLIMANSIGIPIPKTCVTNSPWSANKFYNNNNKDIVFKCLSQPVIDYGNNLRSMIHTSKVNNGDFSGVSHCPCLFQENIMKQHELRIAVIGEATIAVKIDSQAYADSKQDWRKEIFNKDIYSASTIPETFSKKLVDFNARMNLAWSMVDAIVTERGDFIFLEANPDGAWLWLEQFMPSLDITGAVSNAIQRNKRSDL